MLRLEVPESQSTAFLAAPGGRQPRSCCRVSPSWIAPRSDSIWQYAILQIKPLPWDIRDLVVARDPAMGDVREEIRRCQLQARGFLDLYPLMEPLRPQWQLTVPEGLDWAAVSEADLGVLAEAEPGAERAFHDPERQWIDHQQRLDGWRAPAPPAGGRSWPTIRIWGSAGYRRAISPI